jgi:hypothetical protein
MLVETVKEWIMKIRKAGVRDAEQLASLLQEVAWFELFSRWQQ